MKTLNIGVLIFTLNIISFCLAENCIKQSESSELDSLLIHQNIDKIKTIIESKKQADFDTNYYRYKQRCLENELVKIDSLKIIVDQSESLNEIVQYRTLKIFINKRDKYKENNRDSTLENQYKTCLEKKSLKCIYIVRYLHERNRIWEQRKSQISSQDEIQWFTKYTDEIKKYDSFLSEGNVDTVLILIKADIAFIDSKFEQHNSKIKCLNQETENYSQIIQVLDEFENSDDIIKQKNFERLKLRKEFFSIANAGKEANKYYNIFFKSTQNNRQALIHYLVARKKKIEFVNKRKVEIRENYGIAKQLYKLKKYNKAQSLVLVCKNEIEEMPAFKMIYDSLCFLNEQLDKSIEDARHRESKWTSKDEVIKSYQFALGAGLSYNPSLMKFEWNFYSFNEDKEFSLPVYKLKGDFGINFSGELGMYLYPDLVVGVKAEIAKIKYTGIFFSTSQNITDDSRFECEYSVNYQINSFSGGFFGKWYFRTSPGFQPYIKMYMGMININRDQISKTDLFSNSEQPNDLRRYYLNKKYINEFQIIPEIGVDFLKSANSLLVYGVYIQTMIMTGNNYEMLGHFRGEAGFKIGLVW